MAGREACPTCILPGGGAELQRAGGLHVLELHGVAAGIVVGIPLILVVAGEDLAGLADRDVEQLAVPIGQVGGHAHGGRQRARGLLDALDGVQRAVTVGGFHADRVDDRVRPSSP